MPTIIDRYNESVCFYPFRPNHPKGKKILRKDKFNRKNPRTAKRVRSLIKFLYESKTQKQRCYFVTITTNQHRNGYSDRDCFHKIALWLKNRKVDFVCVAERQTNTNDIHFHLIIRREKDFVIRDEVKRLAGYFNVIEHPALFDVKRIVRIDLLRKYLSKYFTKRKAVPELFECRTWSSSKRLRDSFKEFGAKSIVRASDDFILTHYHLFKGKRELNEFCTLYKFDLTLWKAACDFQRAFIKGGFKTLNL